MKTKQKSGANQKQVLRNESNLRMYMYVREIPQGPS